MSLHKSEDNAATAGWREHVPSDFTHPVHDFYYDHFDRLFLVYSFDKSFPPWTAYTSSIQRDQQYFDTTFDDFKYIVAISDKTQRK